LSLNNKRDNFTREDILSVAKNMDIKNGCEIIQKVVNVVSQWSAYAKEAGVKKGYRKQINETLRLM
jgi:serine/threonine-protein kinase HipA